MKTKIAEALKTKYQRFGLSNEAIDRIALAKEKTVTSEEDIETAIADAQTMELIASEIQKMRDSEIRKRTDVQKSFDDYKKAHGEPQTPPTGQSQEEEPAWAKGLREMVEGMNAKIIAQEKERKRTDAYSNVKSALEKAGCTNAGILKLTLKGFELGEKETETDAVKRLTADYNQNVKDTFGEGVIPPAGTGAPATPDLKKLAEERNAYLRQQGLLPQEETQ